LLPDENGSLSVRSQIGEHMIFDERTLGVATWVFQHQSLLGTALRLYRQRNFLTSHEDKRGHRRSPRRWTQQGRSTTAARTEATVRGFRKYTGAGIVPVQEFFLDGRDLMQDLAKSIAEKL